MAAALGRPRERRASGGGGRGRSEEQLRSSSSRHCRPRTVGLPRREEPVPLRCLGAPFLTFLGLLPLPLRSQTSSRARGPGGGWEPGPAQPRGPGWGAGVADWGRRRGGGGGPRSGGGGRRPGPVPVAPLLGGPGGTAFGEGAPRGRVLELGWPAGCGGECCGFCPGLRPWLSLGEGPCASGCAGVGGGVGTGDSAFPASAGSWGAGAGPGTPPEVPSPGSPFRA